MFKLSFLSVSCKAMSLFWLFPLSIVHNPNHVCWILMHGRAQQCVCGSCALVSICEIPCQQCGDQREDGLLRKLNSRAIHTFYSNEVVIEPSETSSLSPQAIIFNPLGLQSMDLISCTHMTSIFEALFLC